MKQEERNALGNWEEYKADISNSTPVDVNMSRAEREKHRLYLEAHPVEWIQYFFPEYANIRLRLSIRKPSDAYWGTMSGMRYCHGAASWPRVR